ncbi:DUF1534 domain-containing protein [Pseudomonas caricapapayae]|nr:DUF1534 domain-containing protein [Pseudomonas caricapapayae]
MRWHAVSDALHHKFAPRCLLGTGRRASRTAFPRGALGRSLTPQDEYRANALRWHAVRGALRHKFAPRCLLGR